MKRLALLPLLLVTLLVVAACAPAAAPAAEAPAAEAPAAEAPAEAPAEEAAAELVDIVDTAVAAGSFTTLVAAVEAAGLVDALKAEGPFTVFAPTDEAFAALPEGTIDALLADPAGDLTQILLYHVVPGAVAAGDLSEGLTAETLQGGELTFTLADGAKVNGVNIVATDVLASNGIIHVVDAVILPPADEAAAEEAPAAEASEAMTETAMAEGGDMAAMSDIVDTAVAAGSFTTLVAAVQAAGLVDALKAEGPFTVFAPSDEAFAKIDAATIEALLADPTGDLTQILLYHVVPGKVMSTDLSEGLEAETLQGGNLTITLEGGPKVNGINIVTPDIETSNGVIHVIDGVILPEADGGY